MLKLIFNHNEDGRFVYYKKTGWVTVWVEGADDFIVVLPSTWESSPCTI